MYKIATLRSGNPRNFTWNIISNNSVVMPTGGCTVDNDVNVNLPDFPEAQKYPLAYIAQVKQKLSFYLSGATTDSARQVFANTAPDATKASGVGALSDA